MTRGATPLKLMALFAVCLIAATLRAAPPQKLLVCFGDSITAGYGLDKSQSYPADLEHLLTSHGYHYQVVNQGVPGDTTKDALARVNQVVALHPDIVVLEFGGNDGLRGLSTDLTRRNLNQLLATLQAAHIRILLVGITLPPNYGPDYVKSFSAIFKEEASAHHTALMPMIYDGIYTLPGTIQPDGIHPTIKGSQLIAQHMFPFLTPLLTK